MRTLQPDHVEAIEAPFLAAFFAIQLFTMFIVCVPLSNAFWRASRLGIWHSFWLDLVHLLVERKREWTHPCAVAWSQKL